MATLGTFTAGQVLTAVELNEIATMNQGASARPLLTDGAYIDGTNGLVLSGLSGNYASTPDSAALSVTGDIDIKVKLTMADWTPAAVQVVASKYDPTGDQRSYRLDVLTAGTLTLYTSADGVTPIGTTSSVATGFANGATKWVRVTRDGDDGSGNRVTKFYTSDNGTAWSQLGTTITNAGTTSIYDSTAPLVLGGATTGSTANFVVGTIHRVIIQDAFDTADNTTNVVFDADFSAEAADTLAFTEDSSNADTVSVTTTRYTVGIPNAQFISVTVTAPTLNVDRYLPFTVSESIDVDMFAMEVTTGPASPSTVYFAIYEADENYQPTGTPLTTTSTTVGTSATGAFYAQVTPVRLKPGAYVIAYNLSVNLNLRVARGGNTFVPHTISSQLLYYQLTRGRTAAAFTASPQPWNSGTPATTGFNYPIFLRWKAA